MRSKSAAAVLLIGVVATACGGDPPPVTGDDSGVTLPEPADGPAPDLPVSEAAAASSPLPEVVVRRLNGPGGWAQFKNELPSEQPLLVWFWAPH